MYSPRIPRRPLSRYSSQSSDSDSESEVSSSCYTRPDESCLLSLRVGQLVWVRSNGGWAPGVVLSNHPSPNRLLHTYTVLTHVRISTASLTYIALMPITTSTFLGTLKLYDSYTTALLHGEGISIISGTKKTDILDLKMRAHAWLDRTRGGTRI